MADVLMPRLSDSMAQGTILRWFKSEGEEVELGEELVEIETDKAGSVYEAEVAGELVEIVAEPGETRSIGEVIARIGVPAPTAPGTPGAGAPAPEAGPVAAGGRRSAKGEIEVLELDRAGQSMARRVAESKAIVPHLYLGTDADLEAAEELVAAAAGVGVREIVLAAAARALRSHPVLNSTYRDGKVERYSRINVGWVVPAGGSVVVPTVLDADRKGLAELGEELGALTRRVEDGTITPPQMSGGTFTVTDVGPAGVTALTTIVNPPQAASLAIGAPRSEPVVRAGSVVPGRRLSLSLSCDHRVVHAAAAASFLAQVRDLVESPGQLQG